MVVDASAMLSILLKEDDANDFQQALALASSSVMASVNYWEVLVRAGAEFGGAGAPIVERAIAAADVQVVAVDAAVAREAAIAFTKFGRRTPAGLNLGDCFAYALAMREGDGLLFKGNDFSKTDVLDALRR